MLVIDDGKELYFQNGLSILPVDRALLDRMDGIRPSFKAEEHIHPSKYESRLSIAWRIWDALDEKRTCSICGNGATSLAKKLIVFSRRHLKFQRFAMVTVSRNPNLEKIKESIIQQIGKVWINHYTLILDGFWWELNDEDFKEIGIFSPRIVYTSRNEDTYKRIESHHIFHVSLLEDEEAWDLFTEIAGKAIEDLDLHETARKIVDECDGFRISILTVASTLKDKPANVWVDSLTRLQNLKRISDKERVFSLIRLSYDLLNDKEAQLLFCLCCLFPEDFNIPVEDLVLFGKGLQLFENVDSMEQARDRVECNIHKLKFSCFLLDGDEDEFVKVHDMLRDFGVSISSKFEHPFVARCDNGVEEWPLESTEYQNCGAISFMCQTMEKQLVDLECPNLHLLQLSHGTDSARLPTGLFEGLQNLQVLSLNIPLLSQPLTALERLRTLCITESISDNRYTKPRPRIGDLLGHDMKHLEIFSFSTARPYDDFPREIGLLHNLRFLRFNRERLKYIPRGVLSKLLKLEELYLPLDFISWGRKEEGDRMNASLSEIESLLQLTATRIGVPKSSILAEKFVMKLTRYHVFIGSHVSPDYEFGTGKNSKKVLEVFDVDADDFRVSWVSALVWKSESLRLKQVRNLKNIITWEPKEDEYIEIPQWKKICICDCNELEYLATGRIPWTSFSQLKSLKLFGLCNMKEIWQGPYFSQIEGSCFGNLGEIHILFCRKLKYVFPLSVATQLRQLHSLQICFCDEIQEIFYRQQMDNDGKIQSSDPTGETTSTMNPTVTTSIRRKSKLVSLTTNSITKRLFGRGKQQNKFASHKQMEENSGKEDYAIIFPQLKTMELAYMDKLRVFYDGNHSILLPSLQSLSIFRCNHMEAFCYGIFRTPSLQHILINGNRYSVTQDLNAIVKSLCTIQSFS